MSWFYVPSAPQYLRYFFHSTGPSLSEEYCQKIYSVAAQAAVMEDKCRVHAGLLDPDGSVFCRICFRVEILSESLGLYLCGRLKSLRLSISAGMAQWSFMGLCHSFYDIVTYTAGYSGSFQRDENKSHLFWNERQFTERHPLLQDLFLIPPPAPSPPPPPLSPTHSSKGRKWAANIGSRESCECLIGQKKRCFSMWAWGECGEKLDDVLSPLESCIYGKYKIYTIRHRRRK